MIFPCSFTLHRLNHLSIKKHLQNVREILPSMDKSIWLVFAFADFLYGNNGAVLLQSGGEDCTQRDSSTSFKLLPWVPQTAWAAPGWGWNSQESSVNPGQSAMARKSQAGPIRATVTASLCSLDVPCRNSFVLVVPLTLLLCAGTRTKRLPETHSWVVHAMQLLLGTTIQKHFYSLLEGSMPTFWSLSKGKSLWPSLSDIKQKAWHNLGMPQMSSATTGVSKTSEIMVRYRWCSELHNGFLQPCKSHCDQLQPSHSLSGYFYLLPPQYCTFSIMSPGSNLPSLAITPSR